MERTTDGRNGYQKIEITSADHSDGIDYAGRGISVVRHVVGYHKHLQRHVLPVCGMLQRERKRLLVLGRFRKRCGYHCELVLLRWNGI
jgi:hypothetical protein